MGAPAPQSSDPSCCAVLVHYRCEADLLDCVASLARYAPDLPVLVVENGSADGALERLRAAYASDGRVTVLDAGRNGGFGAGCNVGIDAALRRFEALEHVLLLNPDTVVEAGFLDALRATAARRGAGVVGGRILERDTGAVWFENGRVRPWTLSGSHVPAPVDEVEFETGFVTGALMLVDAPLLREGLRFDEGYFLYCEDMDLCAEVRRRGRSLWVTTAAVVRHRGAGSQRDDRAVVGGLRARQLEHMTRSKMLYARKWLGPVQRSVVLLTAVLAKPLAGLWLARGRTPFLVPYFRGLWSGLGARRAPGPRRPPVSASACRVDAGSRPR